MWEQRKCKKPKVSTPPIPLKGKTKLCTMRPVFIKSYYNDLFFVRDLKKTPYGMDQWKKLEPKTNTLLLLGDL